LRCCAAEKRDVCQVGTLNESMSEGSELEMMVVCGKTKEGVTESGCGREAAIMRVF
jgi:hypothetical protein